MMAFPILVEDPFRLHKQLLRRGIFTFQFTKIWWWDPTREYCDLYKRNLLRPARLYQNRHDIAEYDTDATANDCRTSIGNYYSWNQTPSPPYCISLADVGIVVRITTDPQSYLEICLPDQKRPSADLMTACTMWEQNIAIFAIRLNLSLIS